jgi:transcriptional regulatory protein AMDR
VRIIYIGVDVSNINFLVRERAHDETGTVHHFPLNDVVQRPSNFAVEAMPKDAFALPDKAVVDRLVEAYFTLVNPGCPLVEEDLFLKQYSNESADDPPSLLLLQAILLVGAHVSLGIPERAQLKSVFYRRAKRLFDARFEKNRDIVVRAALLLTWHSDGPEDPGSNSWYWVGIAVRTAIGLGMHRDAAQSPLKHYDMKAWRRIWWILFQFDIMVSVSYGHPPAMQVLSAQAPKSKLTTALEILKTQTAKPWTCRTLIIVGPTSKWSMLPNVPSCVSSLRVFSETFLVCA